MSPQASSAELGDVREGGAWTPAQRRKNDAIFVVIRAALRIAQALPRLVLSACCCGLGVVAFLVLGRERRRARARLTGALGADGSLALTAKAFVTAGGLLADCIALLSPKERAHRGLSLSAGSHPVFEAALREGRGVVFIAAHLGPWERMAALLVAEGFPVATVARESYDPRLTELYERLRAPRGVRSIYRGRPGAARAVVRELGRGGAVGFLVDIPGRVLSREVELFGEPSPMALGPARIALTQGAAVVVGTPVPAKNGAEVLLVRMETGDLEASPEGERILLARMARELDARLRRWPSGWLGLFAPRKSA